MFFFLLDQFSSVKALIRQIKKMSTSYFTDSQIDICDMLKKFKKSLATIWGKFLLKLVPKVLYGTKLETLYRKVKTSWDQFSNLRIYLFIICQVVCVVGLELRRRLRLNLSLLSSLPFSSLGSTCKIDLSVQHTQIIQFHIYK